MKKPAHVKKKLLNLNGPRGTNFWSGVTS
jgi:hypothetical protein